MLLRDPRTLLLGLVCVEYDFKFQKCSQGLDPIKMNTSLARVKNHSMLADNAGNRHDRGEHPLQGSRLRYVYDLVMR